MHLYFQCFNFLFDLYPYIVQNFYVFFWLASYTRCVSVNAFTSQKDYKRNIQFLYIIRRSLCTKILAKSELCDTTQKKLHIFFSSISYIIRLYEGNAQYIPCTALHGQIIEMYFTISQSKSFIIKFTEYISHLVRVHTKNNV